MTATEDENARKSLLFNVLAIGILILLNLVCYLRTVSGYFLADDFVHVAYLTDVFNGHFYKLLENFTGNWMHAWGTQFYRPLISVSLAIDYWIGSGSALPFHVSNTIYHLLSSILLFLSSRRLLREFGATNSNIAALAAGVFFAVCPLHTEVVSWIIGRVDGLCHVFFMAAFYFYLVSKQTRTKWAFPAALVSFAMSLMCKEMAATLPPLLVLTSLVLSTEKTIIAKAREAIKESLWFWGMLGLYFGVRIVALGTVSGGYGGSVGEGLSNASFGERFKSASKILLPFNAELISPYDRLVKNLVSLYKVSGVFVLLRLLMFRVRLSELKIYAFCLGWFVLSLLPTYSVFNINDSLMCSRFAYFATAPFCLLLAFVLTPTWKVPESMRLQHAGKWFSRISFVLLVAYAIVFCSTTMKNNRAWSDAGNQVRQFRAALAGNLAGKSENQKLALLNIPHRMEGAHMIYNGAMLSVLLSEPLSRPSIATRVLNFEPATYGDPEFINVSRLRKLLKDHAGFEYCYWDADAKRLLSLKLDPEPVNLSFELTHLNDSLRKSDAEVLTVDSPVLNINSASCDFVVCNLRLDKPASAAAKPGFVTLFWSSKNFPEFSAARSISLPAQFDGIEHTYMFPVSERKSWLAGGEIQQVRLQLPITQHQAGAISSIKIISGQSLMPALLPVQLAEGVDGINRMSGDKFQLQCDAGKIPGCETVVLELSKPNSWFEHYSGTLRDREFSPQALKQFKRAGKDVVFDFTRKDFPQPAYYEIRAFALDSSGKVIGICSDPINLQID